ncbi:CopG family transcriptional regulator [Nocardioides sp.]|uniref:ribbon-helix-helix domain-containing protein n=1 Tax=Nocardioides sp. TaxID=35761 RepID=UPI0039E65777
MRTTLSLDDDVAALVDRAVHDQRSTMKQVVNDALRKALSTKDSEPFRTVPHHGGPTPGVDSGHINGLADELLDEELVTRLRRR